MSKRTTPHGVVVGADGSPSSRVAVRWAAREAAMRHVPLTVVHVAASLPVAASTLVWGPAESLRRFSDSGERSPQSHRRRNQSRRGQRRGQRSAGDQQ